MHTIKQIRTDHDYLAQANQPPLPGGEEFHFRVDPLWSGEINDFMARTLDARKLLLYPEVLTRLIDLQTMLSQLRRIGTKSDRTLVIQEEIEVARGLISGGWQKIDAAAEGKLNQWLENSECLVLSEPDDRGVHVRMMPWDGG